MEYFRALAASTCLSIALAGCQADPGRDLARHNRGLEIHVPGDHATIQAALDAATWGDVVIVAPGDYIENPRLQDGVILQGSGADQTRLHGYVSFWSADMATLRGFTITAEGMVGLPPNVGIGATGDTFIVEDNVIQGFGSGIVAEGETIGHIRRNLIRQNGYGLKLVGIGFAVEVTNNLILNNTQAGLAFADSAPRIRHNTIVGNGFASTSEEGGGVVALGPRNDEIIQNNIIVSNRTGISSLEGTKPANHHNLIWGNVVNYVGDAAVGPGDLSQDPLFRDAPAKDYRLTQSSPAVDAGLDLNVIGDLAGQTRPRGAAPDLGAYEFQPVSGEGDLVINEVMANPTDESKGEFIELYNPTGMPIDAAGLLIDDGDSADALQAMAGSSLVPAGGYAVVLDPDYPSWATPYDIPPGAVRLTVAGATLGSGLSTSDPVTLSRGAQLISTWAAPFDPGNGISAERIDAAAPDTAGNWVASPCGASPGRENCISSGGAPGGTPTLAITEVMASPVVQSVEEYVELYNYGDAPVELTGLSLSDGDSTDALVSVAGKISLLQPGQYGLIIDPDLIPQMAAAPYQLDASVPVVVTVDDASIGNGLAADDPVSLLGSDAAVISTFSHPRSVSHQSIERIDPFEADLASNWIPCPCPALHSAGRPNCAASGVDPGNLPDLLINEIMANPLDEDTGEFIEIFNAGTSPVDVADLWISDGDATDGLTAFPGHTGTTIPAGGYGLILDPEYAGQYATAAGAVWLAPTNTTLGNGLATTDPIQLLASDGVTVISACSHPANPGNGISLERIGDAGDVESNWTASTCSSGSSPGGPNCAGGAVDPDPDPTAAGLVLSEVMANPLDEYRGEFVEIVNLGDTAVDLAGFVLSDGDASDTLGGYHGGPTLLAAGGIAVVLDSGYADLAAPYIIPPEALLLTTGDATLGSGLSTDDPISLLAPDGTTVLSTYAQPFNPGDGVSAERVDLLAADTPDNWLASPCPSGSSPGAVNCADGAPSGQVVDVNSASAAELQQVGGIGPATAAAIVAYRDANGPFEALDQLTVLPGVTQTQVGEWMVAAEGEPAYVIGLAGAREMLVFSTITSLLDSLPDPASPSAWQGQPVRIQRAAAIDPSDSADRQQVQFADWGVSTSYTPQGTLLPVFFDLAPGETVYDRSMTDHANALADWQKEDGDPYNSPDFYRWSEPLWSYGAIAYGHVYALQGVIEVDQGAWRLRIRARSDVGVDRIVLLERWLDAVEWQNLEVVWTYNYKPAVVSASSGYSYALPYRLTLAHPCRLYWWELTGVWLDVPRCPSFEECGPMTDEWATFNQALAAWRNDPTSAGDYCFTYDFSDYCFSAEEEILAVDILNGATYDQLLNHCYSTTLANTLLANRPYASVDAYDATSGVGPRSLWNLLVCYVRSGDWPEAPTGTVAWVQQNVPDIDGQIVDLPDVIVSELAGQLITVCDEGSAACIPVYSYATLPPGLAIGAHVGVHGLVKYYQGGDFWELTVDGIHTWLTITSWGTPRAPLPGDLIINEFFADPQNDLGDANCDGLRDAIGDEFVELVNTSLSPLILDGVTFSDSISVRHVFNPGTVLNPGQPMVVFGGGPLACPTFAGLQVELASSGGLSLNNTGDTLSVRDAQGNLLCTLAYSTEADYGQSLTLAPDLADQDPSPTGLAGYTLHGIADQAGDASFFSPGTRVDGSPFIP